ncbi:PQQ-binding-like beta-propeller repeat protein [Runella sp. MFBS21]|uniref:outer membrane protein assembly factor BamB family protein n=1 Tax=Runella sp. MFBS21 TaxID=3034018 RepID=UPI0023F738D2|nr:PQQ-binding-like beta-propeller repeat protein [Runella sp. MFBS21]MDF7817206.1 PQQ-binding-like beta-propeller repeat protein [Runella sp. MFBS21]
MFKHINNTQKTGIVISKKYDILLTNNKISILNKLSNENIIELEFSNIINCNIYENILLVNNNFQGEKTILYLEENFNLEQIKTLRDSNAILIHNTIISRVISDNYQNKYLAWFDIPTKQYVWKKEYEFDNIFFSSVAIFIYSFHSISQILHNGEQVWQSDLSPYKWHQFDGPKPAQIQQIIGISENILLVWMAGEQLLGLDVATGKVLWKIDFAPYFHITKWFTGSYYWNIQNHKLYLLKYLYYFEIDLTTQEVKILWKNPEESYSITHCCYTDEYVYFIALGSELGIEILGTFNRLSLTIDWLEYLTMPRLDAYSYVSFHQAPQVDGDRLYVLDSGGTLHIFEKESSTE